MMMRIPLVRVFEVIAEILNCGGRRLQEKNRAALPNGRTRRAEHQAAAEGQAQRAGALKLKPFQ
jgi:hypothetical protein